MAIDGFVIEPTQPEIGRAADIICGCNLINSMDQETAGNFHMFVQEVLDTTIGEENRRLSREVARLEQAIAMWRNHAYAVGTLSAGQPPC